MAKRKDEAQASDEAATTSVATSTPTPASTEKTPEQTYAEFQKSLTEKGITLTTQTFNSLGLKVPIGVVASIDDFDKLAGKQGEALDQAVKNIVYRGPLAVFRDQLCTAIEAKTGIERLAEYAKNEDGSDKVDAQGEKVFVKWLESEAKYLKRVAGDNPEQYQGLADGISKYLVFDPSAPEPKSSGPKSIAKMYTTTAQQIFDQGRGEAVTAKLNEKYGMAATADVAGLASLIKHDQGQKKLADEYAS